MEIENGNLADACKQRINVLEAMHFICSSWNKVTSNCVAHSFAAGGFPKSIETPQEEENCVDDVPFEKEFNLLASKDVNFKDYVGCDESIVTSETTAVPTIEDMMDSSSDEDVDNSDELSEPLPSFNEAVSGLKLVRNYFLGLECQEKQLQILSVVENALMETKDKNKKQKEITDFFHKKVNVA